MVGARNIRPARDSIERRVVFATSEVFGIFIRWFSGRAADNEYSVLQYSRNMKFSGFDMVRVDSFMNLRAPAAPAGRCGQTGRGHQRRQDDGGGTTSVRRVAQDDDAAAGVLDLEGQ